MSGKGGWAHQVYLVRAQTKLQKNFSCNELLIYLNSFHSALLPSLSFFMLGLTRFP